MANISQSNHKSYLLFDVRTWQEAPCVSMRNRLHSADGETLARADITSYYTGQRRGRIQRETLQSNSPLCWGEKKTQHQHAFKTPQVSPYWLYLEGQKVWRTTHHENMGADLNGSLMVGNLLWTKVAWDWPDEIIHTQSRFKQEHGHFRA